MATDDQCGVSQHWSVMTPGVIMVLRNFKEHVPHHYSAASSLCSSKPRMDLLHHWVSAICILPVSMKQLVLWYVNPLVFSSCPMTMILCLSCTARWYDVGNRIGVGQRLLRSTQCQHYGIPWHWTLRWVGKYCLVEFSHMWQVLPLKFTHSVGCSFPSGIHKFKELFWHNGHTSGTCCLLNSIKN